MYYLASSKLNAAVLGNFAFAITLCLYRLALKVLSPARNRCVVDTTGGLCSSVTWCKSLLVIEKFWPTCPNRLAHHNCTQFS